MRDFALVWLGDALYLPRADHSLQCCHVPGLHGQAVPVSASALNRSWFCGRRVGGALTLGRTTWRLDEESEKRAAKLSHGRLPNSAPAQPFVMVRQANFVAWRMANRDFDASVDDLKTFIKIDCSCFSFQS